MKMRILTVSMLISLVFACTSKRVVNQEHRNQLVEQTQFNHVEKCESLSFCRYDDLICENPQISLVRISHDDTVFVSFRASKISKADLSDIYVSRNQIDTSLTSEAVCVESTNDTVLTPASYRGYMIAVIVALSVLIGLSLRGIGFRR